MIEAMTLLPLLPATAAELIAQTGRTHESVYQELVHLEGCGMARVQPVHCGGVRIDMEWHPGLCAPDALCYASRDGFCEVAA